MSHPTTGITGGSVVVVVDGSVVVVVVVVVEVVLVVAEVEVVVVSSAEPGPPQAAMNPRARATPHNRPVGVVGLTSTSGETQPTERCRRVSAPELEALNVTPCR
jgi:hypothetical protein